MFGASHIRQQVNILADRRQRLHHLAGKNTAAESDGGVSPSVTHVAPRARKKVAGEGGGQSRSEEEEAAAADVRKYGR